jgi:hypothetical protein
MSGNNAENSQNHVHNGNGHHQPPAAEAEPVAQGESLEKVRELLGDQMKGLQEATRRTLETLEGYFKKEVESIVEQVRAEQQARATAVQDEARERADALRVAGEQARAAAEQMQQRLGEFDQRSGENQRKLREEFHEQTKALRSELAGSQRDLTEMLELAVGELKRGKTDRAELAELFGALASRFSADESTAVGGRMQHA